MGTDPKDIPEIVWQELAADLWEARLVEPTGLTLYAGYMAQSPGDALWRGYVGAQHDFVAHGTRAEVRRAVAESARAIWAAHRPAEGTHEAL